MILSLQGCMAVGKTTAARYLEQHCQQAQVCFEDNAEMVLTEQPLIRAISLMVRFAMSASLAF